MRIVKAAVAMAEVNAYQAGHAAGLAAGRRESTEALRAFWMMAGYCPCGALEGADRPQPHVAGCLVALAMEEGRKKTWLS